MALVSEPLEIVELRRDFNLSLLREGTMQARAEQLPVARHVLQSEQDLILNSDTSSGKTLLFLLKAFQIIAAGGIAVFLTLRKDLVGQCYDSALHFGLLQPEDVLALTGEESPKKRAEALSKPYRLLIMTRESFLNDFRRGVLDSSKICFIGIDEIHQGQGEDAYVKIFNLLRELPQIQQLGLTAFMATNETKLNYLLESFDPVDRRYAQHRGVRVREQLCFIGLDDQLLRARRILISRAWELHREFSERLMGSQTRQLELWDDFQDAPAEMQESTPNFSERQALLDRASKLPDEKKRRECISWGAELGLQCWLEEALSCLGRYAFLEDFGHRYAAHRLRPRLRVSAITRHSNRKISEGNWFETRLVNDPVIVALFSEFAKGTLYEHLLHAETWEDLFIRVRGILPPATTKPQRLAEGFFNLAATEAARNLFDHPKITTLLDIFYRHARDVYNGRIIVFDRTRRHAKFLSMVLNHDLQQHGFKAGYVIGAQSRADREIRDKTLQQFRSGELNILVSTDTLRQGTDVPFACIGAEYAVASSNPISRHQTLGRFVRERVTEEELSSMTAVYYWLLTNGTREPASIQIGRRRESRMITAIRRHARPV